MSATLDDRVLRTLIDDTPGRISKWLGEVADNIRDNIIDAISLPGPSDPGDPPGVDTGALVDSMESDQLGPLLFVVYAQPEYAVYLELGTEKMAKRPFFTPEIEDWRRELLAKSAIEFGLIRV